MPEVEIIDIKEARKRKEMNGLMSDTLTAYCRKALADGKQIILFQTDAATPRASSAHNAAGSPSAPTATCRSPTTNIPTPSLATIAATP